MHTKHVQDQGSTSYPSSVSSTEEFSLPTQRGKKFPHRWFLECGWGISSTALVMFFKEFISTEESLAEPANPALEQSQELCSAKSLQSRPTLCDPLDGSPPGSSVHGILQARKPEWVAMPSCRGSSLELGRNKKCLSEQKSLPQTCTLNLKLIIAGFAL